MRKMKTKSLRQRLLATTVLPALILGCLLAARCPAATLTHRYSFALDATDTIAGANGTLEGNAAIGPSGGLILDGTNSYVQLPNGLFTNYGSASFEVWYADTPVNNTNADLFFFGTNGSAIYCNLGGQGVFSNTGVSSIVTLATPAAGGTNHVVFTVDTNALTGSLYVNGALAAFTSNFVNATALARATTNFLGGAGKSSTNLNFRGSILEFRSYSNTLSSLDVAMTDALGPSQPLTTAGTLQDVRVVLPSSYGPGAIFRANVFADYANVTNVNISKQTNLVMLSDNPAAVSIGADGRLTTVALGSANITAIWQSFSNTVPMSVAVPAGVTLVHRYSFNEKAGDFIVHDSVGGANGTTIGLQPTFLSFTGTNGLKMTGYPSTSPFGIGDQDSGYVNLPTPMISDLSEVSIEAWVTWTPGKVALGYGSGGWQRIFDFGNSVGGGGQTYLFLTPATDNVSFTTNSVYHAAITTNYNVDENPRLSWTNFLPTNVLSFVAITYSPSRGLMNMYLNGALVESGAAVIPLSGIIDTNCWLGRSLFSSDPFFNGIFREFRVYSGFLSDSDIAQDYTAGQSNVLETWPGPEVSTLTATNITPTSGTLQGMASPNGQDTQIFFQFGSTTNYTTTTPAVEIGSGTNRITVSTPVSGLVSPSTYHFRCVASNATAMSYGGDLYFTTSNNIVIQPAGSVFTTTATLNGVLFVGSLPFDAFFAYGTTTNFSTATAVVSVDSSNSFVDFSAALNSLSTNTTYYYQLIATNANGILYSPIASFTTGSVVPLLSWGISGGNVFYVNAQIPTAATYQLQASSDLVNWITVDAVNFGSPFSSYEFTDNQKETQPARFFRLIGP